MGKMNSKVPAVGSKSAATRERILVRAAELFREQGYNAVSLRGIAKHADMQATSIYYYFATKDDILAAVLGLGLSELNKAVEVGLQDLPSGASTREQLRCAIHSHLHCLSYGGIFPATFMSVYLHLPHKMRYRKNPAREKYFQLWLDILEAGVVNGDLRADLDITLTCRFILVSITRSVEWGEFKNHTPTELADFFTQMFFDGMAG